MRDPARIPRVLDALRETWEKHPDLRLGQLLMNIAGSRDLSEVWNLEDGRWLALIRAFDAKHPSSDQDPDKT